MEIITSTGVIKRDFYITKSGKRYNINEIAYTRQNIYKNIGKFITETNGLFFDYGNEDVCESAISGVYIYQDNIDKKKGYRIYRELYDYGFNGYRDDELVNNLKSKANKIKLTEFPSGIITLDGKIIGQEMPYYDNSITVAQFCELGGDNQLKPTDIYFQIINIMKELYDNGIFYYDCHAKNFVILYDELEKKHKDLNKIIKLIDFDESYIDFDEIRDSDRKTIFERLRNLINLSNTRLGIIDQMGELKIINDFDDAYEQIEIMKRKLTNKS